MIPIRWGTQNPRLHVACVEAWDVDCGPAPGPLEARLAAAVPATSESLRRAVRDALRWGGFKPTGRNKPACEYLAKADPFPRINAVVDAVNLVSLEAGLPISLLDADRALEGEGDLVIREGRDGESYVFNPSGQVLDVAGLVGVARVDGSMLGNAVKDSMATKTHEGTTHVLAVIWAPRDQVPSGTLSAWARTLAPALEDFGAASRTEIRFMPESA